jgi:gluconolactonase
MLQVFDSRFDAVAKGAGDLVRLCTGAIWNEGPVWMHEDNSVLWSDIPNNRMLRWQPQEGMSVWRDKVEFTNGHTREADGSLLHCSHGLRAIVRTRFGPKLSNPQDEIVVDRYLGKRLNSPNDVVVKSDGTIWFTDPPYGIASNGEGHQAQSEQSGCFVYCYEPASKVLRAASDWLEEPNGLAFSPDESTLYVSDTSAALKTDGSGNHHIVAFDVVNGHELAHPRIFATIENGLSDGFRIDQHGFLYTSSADGVIVFHPDGTKLAFIPVPEKVGNLTFAGEQRNDLVICACSSLYSIRLNTRGAQCP